MFVYLQFYSVLVVSVIGNIDEEGHSQTNRRKYGIYRKGKKKCAKIGVRHDDHLTAVTTVQAEGKLLHLSYIVRRSGSKTVQSIL